MAPPPDLEPADRDPKQLRRTGLTLLALILVGGTLIFIAYEKWATEKASDTRPAIVYRIPKERSLRLVLQDGKTADLFDLRGNVVLVNAISIQNPDATKLSDKMMKRLEQKFADHENFRLVTLVIDPIPAETVVKTLAETAASRDIALPRWWMGTNEPETLHKFVKNELKTATFPHEEDGKWIFDTSITLIDKNGHIRRAVVPQKDGGPPYIAAFDFDQAASWDAEKKLTGTDLTNVQQLEHLLEQTVQTVLNEPTEQP